MFWRETGMKDDDDDVDAREGACSMETAMVRAWARAWAWTWATGRAGRVDGVVEECGSTRRGGVIGATKNQGSGTCATLPMAVPRLCECYFVR